MDFCALILRPLSQFTHTRSNGVWWCLAALLTTLIFLGTLDLQWVGSESGARVHYQTPNSARASLQPRAHTHELQNLTSDLKPQPNLVPAGTGLFSAGLPGVHPRATGDGPFPETQGVLLSLLSSPEAPEAKGGGFGGGGSGSRRGPYGSRSSYGGGSCIGCFGCGGGLSFILFVFVVIFIFSAISRGVSRSQQSQGGSWQSNSFSRQPGSMPNWDALDWSDMSPTQRRNWETLGWSRASWSGRAPAPATDDLSWYQLTPAQQQAARSLGFSQYSWDAS